MGPKPIDPMIRYRAKVDERGPNECWPWTAARFDKGYGAFRVGSRQLKAHRFGYEALVGPIPDGLYVCHTCDNPPCQNPGHWFLGTHGDNAKDREFKGRGVGRANLQVVHLNGETNGRSKLTEADVLEMRRLRREKQAKLAYLAERFGVSIPNVSLILSRQAWTHLP